MEVVADLPDGTQRYGSGCIVAGATVLTAAHVVTGADKVWVRQIDKRRLDCLPLDPALLGHPSDLTEGPDLALVKIDDPGVDLPAIGLARVDRDSTSGDAVERCQALGYPQFRERAAAGVDSTIRDTVEARGVIPVGSGLVHDLLDLQVSTAPRDLPSTDTPIEESPWSGMSGAPVITGGHLIGVITEHAPRAGPSSLTATPLTAIQPDPAHPGWGPGVTKAEDWWALLGATGADELTVLPEPVTRPLPLYWTETLPRIGDALHARMLRLIGRDQDLAEIDAFATGSEGYRWIVGGAWTGKSTLVYEAITTALPDEVDVVCYFLRRIATDADSAQFLAAVIPQLAYLCDQDTPSLNDRTAFWGLWRDAAERAERTGRHLLLLVDGLDEDLRPPGLPSVASLLPTETSTHAHVLVTSRPHPGLPQDLTAIPNHPLTTVTPHELVPFPGAEDQAQPAREQLSFRLERADGHAFNLLGYLTAAAGPLSTGDIAALIAEVAVTPQHQQTVRTLLGADLARVVQSTGTGSSTRFQYAHASLLEQAQASDALGADNLDYFRRRLHAWADGWREKGWPEPADHGTGTPLYLLDTYPSTLTDDPERLAALAADIDWVDLAIRAIGVDATLTTLSQAAGRAERAQHLRTVVATQAASLRPPFPVEQRGYVLRHLCLQALRYDIGPLAADLQQRLLGLADPGPVPWWTSSRATPPALEVGHHDDWVFSAAVLPDGRIVTGGDDGRVRLWDPDHPDQPVEIGHHDDRVWSVAVLPDGRIVSGGTDGRVRLWDPDHPDQPVEIGDHHGWVISVAVLPDGSIVSGGTDGRVRLWDPDHPNQPVEIGHHDDRVISVAVLPDGSIVSGGDDGRVRLWSADHPDQPVEIGHHDGWVMSVAVLPNGRIATGGRDGRVCLWDPDHPDQPVEIGHHDGWVMSVAVLPNGRIATGGDDGRVHLWRPDRPEQPVHLGNHDGRVFSVAVLPDGRIVTGGDDGRVRLWDPDRPDQAVEIGDYDGTVSSVAALHDGRIATGGDDGRVRLWNPDRHDEPIVLGHHDGTVSSVAALPDGRIATGGDDGRVRLWHPDHPDEPVELGHHDDRVRSVAVLPDGRIVTGGNDRRVRLWNPDHPNQPVEIGHHDNWVFSVAVLPDGRIVSGGGDWRVRLWHPDHPGHSIVEIGHHDATVYAIAVLPDGRIATGAADRRVRLWRPDHPNQPVEIGHHDDRVRAVAVLPDGRIASGGDDGRVRLWNPDRPHEPLVDIHVEDAFALAAWASPGGAAWVAIAGRGFSVWLCPAEPAV